MDSKLNIGVIGAGKAGTSLAMAFSQNPRSRVKQVVSRTQKSAEALAKKCGAESAGDNLEKMFQDEDINAVVIASPDKFHYCQTLQAAEAGKHVLCEKPMCATEEEAVEMISACEDAGVLLMVGFVERFNQPCIEAKERIVRGEIGAPVVITAKRCHPRSIIRGRAWLNDTETGGVINYAAAHNIDLICDFMGCEPARVYAEQGQLVLKEQNFTDCAVMTFQFPGGRIAALYETFAYPPVYPHGVDRSLEILGTEGVLRIDFMNQPLSIYSGRGFFIGDSVTWTVSGDAMGGAILNEVEHFISCVLDGKPVLTPGRAGLRAIRIANAARAASESGKAVSLQA